VSEPLAALAARLEDAARRLREDELSPEQAAELAEACARTAAEAGSEIDRRVRAAADEQAAG
jgi:hypothetical protein